jgi:hypothetical protein
VSRGEITASPNFEICDTILSFVNISNLFICILLDMRKALSRDVEKKSLIPIPHPVRPEDLVDD